MNSQPNHQWTKSTCPPIAPPITSTLSPPKIDADHHHQTACLGGGHRDGLLPPPIPPDVQDVAYYAVTSGKDPHRADSSFLPPDIKDGSTSAFVIEEDPHKDESSGQPHLPTPQTGLNTPPTPQVDSCHDLR